DVDGFLVLRREVMIQADEQELLDLRVAIVPGRRRRGAVRRSRVAAGRFGHLRGELYNSIRNLYMAIIECVPNVSEGRRTEVVAAMADAVRAAAGVRLLDVQSDASHNRSVITLAGDAAGVERAVLALVERAAADIDLRTHRGEHPRMGAVDVVPFVPIDGVTMADCVALAKKVGAAIADRFAIPV